MQLFNKFVIHQDRPYRILTYDEHTSLASAILSALANDPNAEFFDECLSALRDEFSDVSEEVIRSIYAFEYEKRMKIKHKLWLKEGRELLARYSSSVKNPDVDGFVLVKLAKETGLAPALLVRIILQAYYGDQIEMKDVAGLIKNPKKIPNLRLSAEVQTCLLLDEFYGPDVDIIKIVVGNQFEQVLRNQGEKIGMKFVEETGSRGEGFDKTPDLKLVDPVMVDGTTIHWIESKAVFADEELHQTYVIQQYARYYARYGPGLVIYWYGFVDTILFTTNVHVIITLDLPIDAITLIPKEEVKVRKEIGLQKCMYPMCSR